MSNKKKLKIIDAKILNEDNMEEFNELLEKGAGEIAEEKTEDENAKEE